MNPMDVAAGIQVKCVSGYWELTLRNGDGLRVLRGSQEGGKQSVLWGSAYLVPLEQGVCSEVTPRDLWCCG